METLVRNLKIVMKSDRMLAEIKLKLIGQKIVLFIVAGLGGLFALGMLNMAVFFAIQEVYGSAIAALLVGLGNLFFVGILLFILQRLETGPEAKIVEEVREMAIADIEAEAKAFQTELLLVRDEIAGMRVGITNLVKNPMGALAPSIVDPGNRGVSKNCVSIRESHPNACKEDATKDSRKCETA